MAKPALLSDSLALARSGLELPDAPAPASPAEAPSHLRALPEPPGRQALPPPATRLEIPDYELPAALALERELGITHVLAQALVRRGLEDPQAARDFLQARELHPPSAFARIDRALGTIWRHIGARTRITVHGDYDVDGVCATAIMVRALRTLGAEVDWFIPSRIEDGYGLTTGTVQRLAARGTKLLITVDCAITAVDQVAAARAAGIEVVVTDHHQPRVDGVLPDCPVIHPAVCGYPCADLCGTAVAYKLAEALASQLVADELELVALATVADLMPLRGENRRLVRDGIAALARTTRPGLRALMEAARVDPSALDAGTLGFRLAPRINAAGRLARADAGLELLLTDDHGRAREIAAELELLNGERQDVEQRIGWEAEEQVRGLGSDRAAYVLAAEHWHPGVIGIVASRIAERHHRPTILIASGAQEATGSGRSIPGFDLLAALAGADEHLQRYGGHRAAAGLTIDREHIRDFAERFEAVVRSMLTPQLLIRAERIDAVISGSQVGLALAEELELLEPTGIGNPSPRLLIPGARLRDVRPMGEGGRHARFTVVSGGARAPAVAFGCEDGGFEPEQPVDASFRLERNCWKGVVEPRLVLRQAMPCDPATIDVLGEGDYIATVLAECTRPLEGPAWGEPASAVPPDAAQGSARTVLDRRGESPLAVITDAVASGKSVLALCADVTRRLDGLRDRTGGFSLTCWHALECAPWLAAQFDHLVALDPPGCPAQAASLELGRGFAHLAWGAAELRFARQMHELEYGLRASLVSLYREVRRRGRIEGEELEGVLRGDSAPGRSARLAGRVTRVLAELGLIDVDDRVPALAIASHAPTELERSPAFRIYAQRHGEGRLFLSSVSLRPAG